MELTSIAPATSIAPITDVAIPPGKAGRHVDPHVRGHHVRRVNDREIAVRSTIVNAGLAERQKRLASLIAVLRITDGSKTANGLPRRTMLDQAGGSDRPLASQDQQMDLVVELAKALVARGNMILDEGVSRYARLTPLERGHLAMARVRMAVEEVACRVRPQPITAYMREDLRRFENILFVESLTRLDSYDSAAVREASGARQLAQIGRARDQAAQRAEANAPASIGVSGAVGVAVGVVEDECEQDTGLVAAVNRHRG